MAAGLRKQPFSRFTESILTLTYVDEINVAIRERIAHQVNLACFGQNIVTGSCLSGLTRGLAVPEGSLAFNTPNTENSLVGMGFGAALRGSNAIYFMKQLDFLLLGMDQLVNTWNVVRLREPQGSFTIFAIVVDSGYEGPQSCLNDLGGIASLAHIPTYAISFSSLAEAILKRHLIAPGCRILAVSQRMFRQELSVSSETPIPLDAECQQFRFGKGEGATLVSLNFSAPQTFELRDKLRERGLDSSLFVVAGAIENSWEEVLKHGRRSGKLVIVDDGKGDNRGSDGLMVEALRCGIEPIEFRRQFHPRGLTPNSDAFVLPETAVDDVVNGQSGRSLRGNSIVQFETSAK